MNPILWVAAFLAVLAVGGFAWSAVIVAGRADALMETYEADQRHEEETAGDR